MARLLRTTGIWGRRPGKGRSQPEAAAVTNSRLSGLIRVSIIILIGGMIAVAVACGSSRDDEEASVLEPVTGLDVRSGGYPGNPTRDEATRRADLIVDAVVGDYGAPFWNTASGERPAGTAREILGDTNARIFTPIVLEVLEVLKGEVDKNQALTFNQYGGQVGQDRFIDEDGSYFVEGQRMIVFLRDCGSERSSNRIAQGFRYAFIQRHVIDSDGNATGIIDGGPIPLDQLLRVIEEQKNNSPFSPTPC